ncbi:mitogen-activated protein kinase [Carpediemonas membranifera]|uniref:non-specific serine/threonine protein kinase n=1 Tax=Carpediemonas membranifera TaxID=201153 RepID=A0A8J6E6U1_9EUKA|nr:mitogen-activated protein kinase [Carpediemonas membranifera]|eukprot:KAG9397507.1 mitogen-activated protein kinase [Carpediemonas membranifera]
MDRYLLVRLIGEGSFGKVWKGRLRGTGQIVAIKFIPKKGKQRRDLRNLRSEIEILTKVRHPSIVCLLDSFETESDICVVTEYAMGDLYYIIGYDHRLPEEQVRSIAIQLTGALYHLHSNRIVHRDLKPQNVLICENQCVKLCDFGFARSMSDSTVTLSSIKGTPLYMAPEVILGQRYDYKSDLWGLGILLYELFQGKPPFFSTNLVTLTQKVMNSSVAFPADASPVFTSFLRGLLQKKSDKRMVWPDILAHPFINVDVPPTRVLPPRDWYTALQEDHKASSQTPEDLASPDPEPEPEDTRPDPDSVFAAFEAEDSLFETVAKAADEFAKKGDVPQLLAELSAVNDMGLPSAVKLCRAVAVLFGCIADEGLGSFPCDRITIVCPVTIPASNIDQLVFSPTITCLLHTLKAVSPVESMNILITAIETILVVVPRYDDKNSVAMALAAVTSLTNAMASLMTVVQLLVPLVRSHMPSITLPSTDALKQRQTARMTIARSHRTTTFTRDAGETADGMPLDILPFVKDVDGWMCSLLEAGLFQRTTALVGKVVEVLGATLGNLFGPRFGVSDSCSPMMIPPASRLGFTAVDLRLACAETLLGVYDVLTIFLARHLQQRVRPLDYVSDKPVLFNARQYTSDSIYHTAFSLIAETTGHELRSFAKNAPPLPLPVTFIESVMPALAFQVPSPQGRAGAMFASLQESSILLISSMVQPPLLTVCPDLFPIFVSPPPVAAVRPYLYYDYREAKQTKPVSLPALGAALHQSDSPERERAVLVKKQQRFRHHKLGQIMAHTTSPGDWQALIDVVASDEVGQAIRRPAMACLHTLASANQDAALFVAKNATSVLLQAALQQPDPEDSGWANAMAMRTMLKLVDECAHEVAAQLKACDAFDPSGLVTLINTVGVKISGGSPYLFASALASLTCAFLAQLCDFDEDGVVTAAIMDGQPSPGIRKLLTMVNIRRASSKGHQPIVSDPEPWAAAARATNLKIPTTKFATLSQCMSLTLSTPCSHFDIGFLDGPTWLVQRMIQFGPTEVMRMAMSSGVVTQLAVAVITVYTNRPPLSSHARAGLDIIGASETYDEYARQAQQQWASTTGYTFGPLGIQAFLKVLNDLSLSDDFPATALAGFTGIFSDHSQAVPKAVWAREHCPFPARTVTLADALVSLLQDDHIQSLTAWPVAAGGGAGAVHQLLTPIIQVFYLVVESAICSGATPWFTLLYRAGLHERVCNILKYIAEPLSEVAVGLLARLTLNHGSSFAKGLVLAGFASPPLIQSLLAPDTADSIAIDALLVLSQLARLSEANYPYLVDALPPDLLDRLCTHDSAAVRAKACNVIGNMCRHNDRFYASLKESGLLATLTAALDDEDSQTRNFACFALGNAAFHNATLYQKLQPAIAPLIDLLNDSDGRIIGNAAGALGNLARSTGDLIEPLMRAGALTTMLRLLVENPKAQYAGVLLLSIGNFARHHESIRYFEPGVMKVLSGLDEMYSSSSGEQDRTVMKYLRRVHREVARSRADGGLGL